MNLSQSFLLSLLTLAGQSVVTMAVQLMGVLSPSGLLCMPTVIIILQTNEIRGECWSQQTVSGSVSEMLCLELLPHFSCHLNETCYT